MRTQTRLTGLWIALVLLYVYCDIYSFHRPGYVADMTAGKIGPFDVSQGTLAGLGALMAVPILMIPACLLLKSAIARWLSILVSILYTLVNIGNLVGETWAYYWVYGMLEIAVTALIVGVAATWTVTAVPPDNSAQMPSAASR